MNRRGFLKGLAAAVASAVVLKQLPTERKIPLEVTRASGSANINDWPLGLNDVIEHSSVHPVWTSDFLPRMTIHNGHLIVADGVNPPVMWKPGATLGEVIVL